MSVNYFEFFLKFPSTTGRKATVLTQTYIRAKNITVPYSLFAMAQMTRKQAVMYFNVPDTGLTSHFN